MKIKIYVSVVCVTDIEEFEEIVEVDSIKSITFQQDAMDGKVTCEINGVEVFRKEYQDNWVKQIFHTITYY